MKKAENIKFNIDIDIIKYYEVIFKLPSNLGEKIVIDSNVDIIRDNNGITIDFTSEEVLESLNEWYISNSSNYGETNIKSNRIGEITINQYDKTGLVLYKCKLFGAQIVYLKIHDKQIDDISDGDISMDDCIDIKGGKLYYRAKFIVDYSQNEYIDISSNPYKHPIKDIGYHTMEIKKGILGKTSKIQEELDELKDAETQNSKIMMMVELADLYGAIEEYSKEQNITMEDLKIFSDITKRAFKNGRRK